MTNRAGESVRIAIQGVDSDGLVMSETTHTVYGFENPAADAVYQRVVDKLQELFVELNATKNSKR